MEYEEQIRSEYNWVPDAVFAIKRAEILRQFLLRERIYRTEALHEKYEAQAKMNLESSLRKLSRVVTQAD